MAVISSANCTPVEVIPTLLSAWIKDPSDPSKNTKVLIRSIDPEVRSRTQSVFYPLASVHPVVVSGVRQAPRGTLTVLITTQAEIDALDALLEPARTVLIQKPQETPTSPIMSFYAQIVGDTTTSRLAQPASRPHREITLNYVEVAAP